MLSKIIWSWIGAFAGIYAVFQLNRGEDLFLIGSFGASAVLIYGAPQAEFSQPRNLIGGHFISALVGITVYYLYPPSLDIALASALAVSFALALMQWTGTMHPPGGATALIALHGDERIHQLGYLFAVYPILSGTLVLFLVALLVNNQSKNPHCSYPTRWF